jgi:hypothetical protein
VRVQKIVTTQLLSNGVVGTAIRTVLGASEETLLRFGLEEDGSSGVEVLAGPKDIDVRQGAQADLFRLAAS